MKFYLATFALVVFGSLPQVAHCGVLVNGGFVGGTLIGWDSAGAVFFNSGSNLINIDSGVQEISLLETNTGLTFSQSQFPNIGNPDFVKGGSAIYQDFTADLGDTLSFQWSANVLPYNLINSTYEAYFFVALNGQLEVLGKYSDFSGTDGNADEIVTPTFSVSNVLLAATNRLVFGTFDLFDPNDPGGDLLASSTLHVDNIVQTQSNTTTDTVPEPTSISVFLVAAGALFGFRAKRQRVRSCRSRLAS